MANDYTVVTTEDQPIVLSATQVVDGTTVGFVTNPHGVYCESALPKTQVASIGIDAVVAALAYNIERLITDGTALGASFVQTVDDSGLLTGAMSFTVGVPSSDVFAGGTLTTQVVLTIKQLYTLSLYSHLFDEAKAHLQATAAL